jgi:hypothetical protein
MKITVGMLRRIIKEEVSKITKSRLNEVEGDVAAELFVPCVGGPFGLDAEYWEDDDHAQSALRQLGLSDVTEMAMVDTDDAHPEAVDMLKITGRGVGGLSRGMLGGVEVATVNDMGLQRIFARAADVGL